MSIEISTFAVVFASVSYVVAPLVVKLFGPMLETYGAHLAWYHSAAMRGNRAAAKAAKRERP